MVTASSFSSIPSYAQLKPTDVGRLKGETDTQKAWKTAKNFENMFVSHFIQQIFASNKEGLFGGGQYETMFRSIWAEKIAASSDMNFGIAETIMPIIIKNQGDIK